MFAHGLLLYVGASYRQAISYSVGFVSRKRPFSTKAQIGLSYAVEKGLYRLNFFSTENSDWRIQSKRSTLSTGFSTRKTQSKKKSTCFLNRSHRSSHYQTHTHTDTRPYTHTRYHIAGSYRAPTLAWLSLLLLVAGSQRGAFLALLASSVYHTTAAARGIDPMLPTTAASAVALAVLGWQQRAVSIPCCQQRLRPL